MNDKRVSPLRVQLEGGILDGDSFELIPYGSVVPPLRLSYAYRDMFPTPTGAIEECGCWLHYECDGHIPEWDDGAIIYKYVNKERMKEDR